MKTDTLTGFLGLLLLMLGGMVLFYDGAHSASQFFLAPLIGWFVLGTGAVLVGLKLHERKLI